MSFGWVAFAFLLGLVIGVGSTGWLWLRSRGAVGPIELPQVFRGKSNPVRPAEVDQQPKPLIDDKAREQMVTDLVEKEGLPIAVANQVADELIAAADQMHTTGTSW
jgi:hypothetical protein